MPIDYSRYPDNWHEFSLRIRTVRARNRCERCGVRNHAWIWRDRIGNFHYVTKRPLIEAGHGKPPFEVASTFTGHPDLATGILPCGPDGIGIIKVIEIVLTVAHLDSTQDVCKCEEITGRKCAIDEHVLALCQRCHLTYDARRHSFNARRTRASAAGQLWLGDIERRYAEGAA